MNGPVYFLERQLSREGIMHWVRAFPPASPSARHPGEDPQVTAAGHWLAPRPKWDSPSAIKYILGAF